MRRVALAALWSHWRRQPLQLATLVLGLALATGLWSAVQAINAEARAAYARAAAQLGTDRGERLVDASGAPIPLATYAALRRAGWAVTPVLEGRARLGGRWITLMGVEALTSPLLASVAPAGSGAAPLDVLTPPGRLFLHPQSAGRMTPDSHTPPVVETLQLPPGVAVTDIATAARLLDRPGSVDRLLILPGARPGLRPLAEVAPDLIRTAPAPAADAGALTESFHLNLTAFGLLSFAVGLFIVHGTAGLAFQQRRGLFRTLRALGLPARQLVALVMGELLALALVSGALGVVLGYLVAAALLPDVAATLRGLYGAPFAGGLELRPGWIFGGLGMALGGAALAGAQGLWRLAHLPILTAPGTLAWSALAVGRARRLAISGLALALLSPLALVLPGGLVGGFALLGGLLLGAALMLPAALGGLIALAARRAGGPVSAWVLADLRAQLPGLSLALMALLLALAANIGVGTMVSSFRLTFTGWLDQRLASELYITARTDAEGAAIAAWAEPRSDGALPIRYAETQIMGAPGRLYGIRDHSTYRDKWPLIFAQADAWDQVAAGQAALINEQLARRAGIWPGDMVTLGPGWSLPVAGVYSDYGNPRGQVTVALPVLLARHPGIPNRQFALRVAPEDADALALALRSTFDLPATAITHQGAIKSASLAIFEKTFVITAALNVLTLGVAGFAMFTSLLTLWSMRLPHLAPVWALGLTRRSLARLEIARSLTLAALTAILALPLGLLLAWVLLTVINVEAFGWRLPMHLFPLDWLRLLALALLAGALAAALPARRLFRAPPARLLGVFANER